MSMENSIQRRMVEQPRYSRSVFKSDILRKDELMRELSDVGIGIHIDSYDYTKLEALLRDILHHRQYSYRPSDVRRLNDMAMTVLDAMRSLKELELDYATNEELDDFLSSFNLVQTEVV